MAERKPSRLNKMPPLPIASTTVLLACGIARLRLLQWPAISIRVMETSSGTRSFHNVSPSIHCARRLTPARLIQVNSTSRATAVS